MIVPTSRASAFASKLWILSWISALISEALSAISFLVLLIDKGIGEALQATAHGPVDDHVFSPNDRAADERRIDLKLQFDFAPELALERLRPPRHLCLVHGARRDQRRFDFAFGLRLEAVELRGDFRQREQAIVLGEQLEQIAPRGVAQELRPRDALAHAAHEPRALRGGERRPTEVARRRRIDDDARRGGERRRPSLERTR